MALPRALLKRLQENAATADQRASVIRSRFNIFDAYSTTRHKFENELGDIQESELLIAAESGRALQEVFCSRVWRQLRLRSAFLATPTSVWGFLILLGVITVCAVFLFDLLLESLLNLKSAIFRSADDSSSSAGAVAWLAWTVFWTCVAVSPGQFLTGGGDGSGLPQIKSILAGTPVRGHFSWRVFCAKLIGLQSALVAGLSVGKEIPFSHISAILAHKMWRWPAFATIRGSPALRRQVLAAAVASGTAAVMGAPIGALMFSVEVTATNYLVSNLWRGFLCATTCAVTFALIHTFKSDMPFRETRFIAHREFNSDLILFAVLGGLCGLLASGFVYFVSLVSAFRRSIVSSAKSRYTYAVCVAVLVGMLTWCTPFTQQSDKANLNALFQIANATNGKIPMNDPTPYTDLFAPFRTPNRFACVAFLWFVKFVNTAMSLSLPMPCGIYLPLLVMSAAFGRFFGEVVNAAFPGTPDAGLFAFVSAAATLSGITHSISSCVIVMEMTAQANNVLPLIVTAVVAYTVSGLFTISIYDMFMELARIPYLPYVQNAKLYPLKAKDVMHHQFPFLTLSSTIRQAKHVLSRPTSKFEDPGVVEEYPLVDSESNMVLLGTVSRRSIEAYLERMKNDYAELSTAVIVQPAGAQGTPLRHRQASSTLSVSDALEAQDGQIMQEPHTVDDSELIPTPTPPHTTPRTPLNDVLLQFHISVYSARMHAGMDERVRLEAVRADAKAIAEDKEGQRIIVDPAPFQVADLTSLSLLHYLFAVCLYSRIYVTQHGRLIGVAYKGDFLSEKWLDPAYREPVE